MVRRMAFGLLGAGAALLGPLIQLYLTLVALTLAGQEPPGNTERSTDPEATAVPVPVPEPVPVGKLLRTFSLY